MSAETPPGLLLGLALRRQRRRRGRVSGRDKGESEGEEDDGGRRTHRPRPQVPPPPPPPPPRATARRRTSSSPLLPVIHEHRRDDDGGSSLDGGLDASSSPGSSSLDTRSRSPGDARVRAGCGCGSSSPSSSSSSESSGPRFDAASDRVVWPPEDGSWPPRDRGEEEDDEGGTMADYGSITCCAPPPRRPLHLDLGEDASGAPGEDDGLRGFAEHAHYVSSSDSDDEDSPDDEPTFFRRRSRRRSIGPSRRSRHLRSLFAALFSIALSAAAWLPLLEQSSDTDEYAPAASGAPSPSPRRAGLFGRLRRKRPNFAEDAEDDEEGGGDDDVVSTEYYRHRHFAGANSSAIPERGVERSAEGSSRPPRIPPDVSFGDLAALMLPTYFQRTVDLCLSTIVPATIASWANDARLEGSGASGGNGDDIAASTTSVMPGEVYSLRKTMLQTRDLLDVFSPVYSKRSSLGDYARDAPRTRVSWGYGGERFELTLESDGRQRSSRKKKKRDEHDGGDGDDGGRFKDLWKTLRSFLNRGYMLIGDFQDLDHAHIEYTSDRLAHHQRELWEWNESFLAFVTEHRQHVSRYLSRPCKKKRRPASKSARCRRVRARSSRLFWGNTTKERLPDGNRDAAASVLPRLGRAQLVRAEEYLRRSLRFARVLPASGDADPDPRAPHEAHEAYHDLRKELRSFLDVVLLFGDFVVPGSGWVPEIVGEGEGGGGAGEGEEAAADGGAGEEEEEEEEEADNPERRARTERALSLLKTARKLLGDLNDDYVAHAAYVEWDVRPEERSRLKGVAEARWDHFRSWARDVELSDQMRFLIDRLDPDAPSGEGAGAEGSADEAHRSSVAERSFESFLAERRASPTDRVVVGNDAGDADSIVSAISLAYVESIYDGDEATPVVSISKTAFDHERPEVNLLFQLAGINDPSEKLLFIEDMQRVVTEDGGSPKRLTLTDHNTLNKSLRDLRRNLIVTEIVDHHKDERKYLDTCSGERRNIAFDDGRALVASATTLVAERLLEHPPPYPSSLSLLLVGTILLDSVNLDETKGKATQRDRDAVNALRLRTDWKGKLPLPYLENDTLDANALFTKLQRAKYDAQFWNSLSVESALDYDYKYFQRRRIGGLKGAEEVSTIFGISSILMPGLDFMNTAGWYDSVVAFMESKHVSFLGIMFAFYDEQESFRRQLAFVSTASLAEWAKALMSSSVYQSVELQLEEVQLPPPLQGKEFVLLFDQSNPKPSRKQVGPMLEVFGG
ncbi:hypothetical protein ACHAWF_006670 [Thalassiosira exigua]